jgi:diacylglycerol O-acyltransferase / wax synthase
VTHETLGPVDAIWLNSDHVENLMVIDCLVLLDGPLDRERLERVVQERLIERFPVFSRRPAASTTVWGRPRWRDVPGFELADHIHTAVLESPVDDAALQEYVGRFVSTPIERDRPLWQMHLIEGEGEQTAIFVRLHHALADGIALTRVLLSITDAAADIDVPDPEFDPVSKKSDSRRASIRSVLRHAWSRLLDAPVLPRLVALPTLLRQSGRVLRKILVTRDPSTVLSGSAGAAKKVVWSEPVSLERVKRAGGATGTTVNDVLVAALAGAVRRYQVEQGAAAVDLPTMVPVNLRPLDEPLPASLGNRFAVVLLTLPSGLSTPFARLAETKRRMDAIKGSPEALITFGLINGIGLTGLRVSRLLVRFFSRTAGGVTTNVPGPREHRYLAGTRITGLLGWVPGSGDQTLGTCIFTYAGSVRIGFKTDARVIPEPGRIVRAFHTELDVLLALTGARADGAPATV